MNLWSHLKRLAFLEILPGVIGRGSASRTNIIEALGLLVHLRDEAFPLARGKGLHTQCIINFKLSPGCEAIFAAPLLLHPNGYPTHYRGFRHQPDPTLSAGFLCACLCFLTPMLLPLLCHKTKDLPEQARCGAEMVLSLNPYLSSSWRGLL
eukprot:1159094-Pelagomonas_calceolata.AAC.1